MQEINVLKVRPCNLSHKQSVQLYKAVRSSICFHRLRYQLRHNCQKAVLKGPRQQLAPSCIQFDLRKKESILTIWLSKSIPDNWPKNQTLGCLSANPQALRVNCNAVDLLIFCLMQCRKTRSTLLICHAVFTSKICKFAISRPILIRSLIMRSTPVFSYQNKVYNQLKWMVCLSGR